MKNNKFRNGLLATLAPLALLFSHAVLAGGPIAQCPSGGAYVWSTGGAGVPFNPDMGDLGPLDNASAVAAVGDAFQVWEDVSTSTASYTNAGSLPVDVDITNYAPYLSAAAPDGLSAIVFDDTGEIFDFLYGAGSGILGFAGPEWGDGVTCEIFEGLSFLNGPSFVDPTAALDVMVHEFGHYSGLGHTVVNGQQFLGLGDTSGPTPFIPAYGFPDPVAETIETMYPYYFGTLVGTRTLHKDDSATLSELYPDASFAATASISGTILLADGITPVTGVNVIARNEADPFLDAVTAISGDYNLDGSYEITGLTPGADYRVYVDEILAGGFSTPLASPFPGPEEYFNGAGESNNVTSPDSVTDFAFVNPDATGVDVIFNSPGPGDPLPVGDDGWFELPIGFDFKVCGDKYTSVFVNANGHLTFGAPDTALSNWVENVPGFLAGPPRIAALWDDLSPYNLSTGVQQGLVTYESSKKSFKVIFADVPEYPNSGANSFTITLSDKDKVDIEYGDLSATDGLAGVSCGGAITSSFETGVDLSDPQKSTKSKKSNKSAKSTKSAKPVKLDKSAAVFELFAVGTNDLANLTLKFDIKKEFSDKWAKKNDTPDKATKLKLPFSSVDVKKFTEIEPTGADIDWYELDVKGEPFLIIDILNGQLDTLIAVFDSTGTPLASDDDGGAGLLSKIVLEGLPEAKYFLAVTTVPDYGLIGAGASGGRYVLDISETDTLPLSLGDDDTQEVQLGFDFPFNGSLYTSVFVNSNGNLTFGSGDTDWSESVSEFLSEQPRIAPLWDDLAPNNGGEVSITWAAGSITVAFDSVPEFFATGSNTFMVTLRSDGSFTVEYGAMTASDGIAGTTEGSGAANPGETDLSAGGPYSATGTTYENFSAGDNDLSLTTVDYNP